MRRHLPHIILLFMLFCATTIFAQAPEKFTYQAVVRDASNHLVTNSPVGVRVSLLQGGTNGTVLYMETHNAVTNANGLVTVVIGSGNLLQGSIAGIDWANGPIFLHTEIDPSGGTNYTVTSSQQLLSVPYALYSREAANGFSGDYNDLTNAPQIPTVPNNVSAFNNDAGYITGYTETDPLYNAWNKDYNDLINKPVIPTVPTNVSAFNNDAGYITGYTETDPLYNAWNKDYNDLINKPVIPTVPTNVSAFTNDVPYLIEEQQVLSISNDTLFLTGGSFVKLPAGFDGDYNSLTNRPNLFSGSYNDLTDQPTIPTVPTNVGAFTNDAGYITAQDIPEIPTVPTNVGAFTNDAGYITMDSVPTIPSNVSAFTNDAGYITAQDIPEFPTVPTNVGAFTNDAGYITMDSVPTVPSNVSEFTNDAGYITAQDIPEIPTIPTNVSDFTNDAGYLTNYTETDPLFNAWDKDYNDLTNKPILFDGDYNSLTNKPTLFDGNYNSLTNKPTLFSGNYNDLSNKPVLFDWDYYSLNNRPTIPTVPTNVSAFTNDVPYLTAEQQVLSISHDTIFLTGGSFVKLPEILTAEQISNMIHPCCDSMHGYVDSVTATTFQQYIYMLMSDAMRHYLDSIAAEIGQQYVDSLYNIPQQIVSHDSIFPAGPCPEAPYATDWDGNVYNTVKIGDQCWMRENLRTWHYADGTLIPSTNINYYYNNGPYGPNRLKPNGNIENVPTYGYLYNFEAVFRSSDTNFFSNAIPSGVQGICPDGWHIPSMAEWQKMLDFMGNYSMYLCDDQTDNVAKALAAQTGWRDDCGNLCAIGTDLSANNASGFSALPAGDTWGNEPHDFSEHAYFWSTTQSADEANYANVFKLDYQTGVCDLSTYGNRTGALSVRCLRDSGTPAPPDTTPVTPPDTTPVTPPNPPAQISSCATTSTHPAQTGAAYMNNGHNGASHGLETVENGRITSVTDYDGNEYPVVQIGSQCWLAENMRCTHSPKTGSRIVGPALSSYGSDSYGSKLAVWRTGDVTMNGHSVTLDSAECVAHKFGLLYNWCAAMDTANPTNYVEVASSSNNNIYEFSFIPSNDSERQGICPIGWHVPTDDEWTTLESEVDGSDLPMSTNWRGTHAVRMAGGTDWNPSDIQEAPGDYNSTELNSSGFSAVPAGTINISLSEGAGNYTCFWTSTQLYMPRGAWIAWSRNVSNHSAGILRYEDAYKSYIYSVRCLRDADAPAPPDTIPVNPPCQTLNITISGETSFCEGESATLTASGASTYVWSNSATGSSIMVNAGGSYTVTGTDQYGCTGTAAVQVIVNQNTQSSLTESVCDSYTWHHADGTEETITSTGVYTYNGINASGCAHTETLTVEIRDCSPVIELPAVNISDVIDVTPFSVTITAHVNTDGGGTVTERGICYSVNPNPTTDDAHVSAGGGLGEYSCTLTGLTPGTLYFMRAYAVNEAGTGYSNGTEWFTTEEEPVVPEDTTPATTTDAVSVVNLTSATVSGTVTADGGAEVTARGFCWGTTSGPTIAGSHTTDGSGTGTFTGTLTGLTPNTTYYVRTYATNSVGTSYGNEITFTTPCENVTVTISGETSFCEGELVVLTASGAVSYTWNNGATGNSITVYDGGTFSVTGYDSYGCTGTAMKSMTMLPGTHNVVTENVCSSDLPYYWHGMSYTAAGTYTYPYANANGCASVDTLVLTVTECTPPPTYTCNVTAGHPAQTGAAFMNNGFNGANHGLETVVDGQITSVTDYDGNEYPVVQIGSQCWLAENMRCTHSPSTGTYIVNNQSTSGINLAYSYTGKMAHWFLHDSLTYAPKKYGLLYNWNGAVDTFNTSYGETSINNNYSTVLVNLRFTSNRQGICPKGWHVPSDEEWTTMETEVNGNAVSGEGIRGSHAGKLAGGNDWISSDVSGSPGDYSNSNRSSSGFGVLPAGWCQSQFRDNGFGLEATFWSATRYGNWEAGFRSMYNYCVGVDGSHTYNLSCCYSVRCLRDESASTAQAPSVTTTSNITGITTNSADIAGEVTSDGGATVTARGVCWSTAHNPTLSDSHTSDGGGTGSFTSSLTGLAAGTTYFVRVYATNSEGTTYGNEVSFTTTVEVDTSHTPAGDAHTCPEAATVTDIDNNVYNTVKIGNQCWMKENLRTTRLPDGANIPSAFDFTTQSPCRLPVDGNPGYVATYGYLYNWNAIMNNGCASSTNPSSVQGICPTGWHVPSEAEWNQLFNYIKTQEEYVYGDTADYIAKAIASQTGWVASSAPGSVGNDPSANNATGFTALPAGFYGKYTGVDTVENFHFGTIVGFGTTTRANNNIARVYSFGFQNYNKEIIRYDDGLNVYSSVRCLRGESAPSSSQADLVPDISTLSVLSVTSTSADVNGQLTNGDAADVTTCGLCVSTSHNPTVNDLCAFGNSRPSSFHSIFTGLTPNTTYYARAFAQNCNGIFYGNEISFTTLLCDDVSVTVYDTVAKDPSSILLYESFDNSELPSGWNIIDQDGDGFNWSVMDTIFNRHTGAGCISSASWDQTAGVLSPNNWLVTPDVTLPNSSPAYLSWYAVAQDTNYKNDHYEVRLTTAAGTSTYDFNHLLMDVSSNAIQYTRYSVDLSAFAGQTVRIAFVHNNCSDEFRVNLDDISVYTGTMPTDYTEHLTSAFGCDSTVNHRIVIPHSNAASSDPKSGNVGAIQPSTTTGALPAARRSSGEVDVPDASPLVGSAEESNTHSSSSMVKRATVPADSGQ